MLKVKAEEIQLLHFDQMLGYQGEIPKGAHIGEALHTEHKNKE